MGQVDTKIILDTKTITECKNMLMKSKMDLLNRFNSARLEFQQNEHSGDEIDQSNAQLVEHTFLVTQARYRSQLLEIEQALLRIQNGTYGFCEETDEPIEIDRLLTIPWTRLSIEGAEIREALSKRVASASK
ncbi:MAG TPA: TraR/DksA family transcriptional regulator [Pseudobdellovibrionaceae bacterium]|nr:TraR/DksA family transcriptional regulator [Pseudobdellovibrionaceae bacterium]